MAVIAQHATLGIAVLCVALGVVRATYYRRSQKKSGGLVVAVSGNHEPGAIAPPAVLVQSADEDAARSEPTVSGIVAPPPRPSPRALTPGEQQAVLAVLHSERFANRAPAEVYATLLDEQKYLCSERTMYRLLAQHHEVRERRDQRRHPTYVKPQLEATRPNQLWSWDITKLLGPAKWDYFHLYVILDVYSRYVVGWMVADRESAALAERLIVASCQRQGITRGQLTLHADRGTSMTSKPVALLLADLGVTKTHSRPHVSNDNPYSEAQFKTLKYQPGFPDRFPSREAARAHCAPYFDWYNTEHHHAGIAFLTPHDVHYGRAQERLDQRAVVLLAAHAAHPERFVNRTPTPRPLPETVWINPPEKEPPTPVISGA